MTATFGFLSSPLAGHILPMSSIALELQRRGHKVVYFTVADAADMIERLGIQTQVFGDDILPRGAWQKALARIGRSRGLLSALFTVLSHRVFSQASKRDLPELLRRHGVTHLVIDQMTFQGKEIAAGAGLPFANVTCALPMNRDPDGIIPPVSEPWRPARSGNDFLRVWRNKITFALVDLSMAPISGMVRKLSSGFSQDLTICGLIPGLNWPQVRLPLTYVGHLIGPRPSLHEPIPWERFDPSEPIIYVSLGTLNNKMSWLYDEILAALVAENLQFVMARGSMSSREAVESHGRGVIVAFASQLECLQRAAVFVSHAGVNSVVESLSLAVPLVLLPITNDQPGMAARAAGAGVAQVLGRFSWKRRHIARAIREVLQSQEMRARASELASAVQSAGGPPRAADILEAWAAR